MSKIDKDSFVYQAYLETLLHRYPLKVITELPFLRVNIGGTEFYLSKSGFRTMDSLREP